MKIHNEYAAAIVEYARIPKAVFAAVAYSLASQVMGHDKDSPTLIGEYILREWEVLHQNGIVQQKPPIRWEGGKS